MVRNVAALQLSLYRGGHQSELCHNTTLVAPGVRVRNWHQGHP
jgi:hypothetical protein